MNLPCSSRCLHAVRVSAAALVGALGLVLSSLGGVDTGHGASTSVVRDATTSGVTIRPAP